MLHTWNQKLEPHAHVHALFEVWLKALETITWVAYIEPPPTEQSLPEQVLKSLARYLTGGPISDRRLISQEHGEVTFRARTGRKTGGDPRDMEAVTLPEREFVRRWSLHILPKGYVKTRRCGGYSNRHRQHRGNWFDIMTGPHRPGWYDDG